MAVWGASYSHQYPIKVVFSRSAGSLEADFKALTGDDTGNPCAQIYIFILFLDALVQGFDDIGVGAGDKTVKHLNHGNLCPEFVKDGSQFQADNAASDYQQPAGDGLQLQGGRGIHDTRILRQTRQHHRPGTRCNDGLFKHNRAVSGVRFDPEPVGIQEFTRAPNDFYPALLRQSFQSISQL